MHQAMKTQRQMEVECHSLLTSVHGNNRSALCQGHFTLKARTPGIEWSQIQVSLRVSAEHVILYACEQYNMQCSGVSKWSTTARY